MALEAADELRVATLEAKAAALQDMIDSRLDFSDRKFFAEKVAEYLAALE